VDDLVRYGEVRLAWLGIHVTDAPEGMDRAGPDAPRVVVRRVDPASPAERAGIQPGDGLMAANGRRVLTSLDWEGRLMDFRPGAPVRLELVREGRPIRIELTGVPDPLSAAARSAAPLGLELTQLTPELRSYLGTRAESGLLVTSVAPGSHAQSIGLQQGDVILLVNGQRVATVDAGVALLQELIEGPRSALVWEHDGQLYHWDNF
jgi:serine protease Do